MPDTAHTLTDDLKTGHIYKLVVEGPTKPLTLTAVATTASAELYVLETHTRTEFPWQNYKRLDAVYATHAQVLEHLGKVDLYMEIGGTPVIVYKGRLYTGCTVHSAKKADKLIKKVAIALGFKVEGV